MYKSCSRCGKVHDYKYNCKVGKPKYSFYQGRTEEEMLRYTGDWNKKSVEIRERSRWLCSVCEDQGAYNYNNLEVHHIIKLREDPSKLLDNYNLICLCQNHHKLADAGLIKKEYLQNLAKKREEKDPPYH